MSHFTVLVIGDDIEGALAPFQENNMGDCPEKYMEFTPISLAEEGYADNDAAIADGHKEHEGEIGYWDNPNKEWDWYALGGRWQGMLKLKTTGSGIKGTPGTMGTPDADPTRADSALFKDIDVDGMLTTAIANAEAQYDKAMSIFGELPVHKSYNEIYDAVEVAYPNTERSVKLDKTRTEYKEQPRLIAVAMAKEAGLPLQFNADEFIISREEYITNASNSVLATYAILHEGEWFSKDAMTDEEYVAKRKEILASLKPEDRISIVDCHI